MVQLNGPYPAIYYQRAFLESRGWQVETADHSIGLFERIFCPQGLCRIFARAEAVYRKEAKNFDRRERAYIERFLSEADRWQAVIPRLTAFLRGRRRETAHLLALANGFFPTGPRGDRFLQDSGGEITVDAAGRLATALLEDLSDFITETVDPAFALIRYLPALPAGFFNIFKDFEQVRAACRGFIMEEFYRPFLEEQWYSLLEKRGEKTPDALGITIPFPGCLAGALVCAWSAKKYFPRCRVLAGGGYVNTELRFLEKNSPFFEYIDELAYDRGYDAWEPEAAGNDSSGAVFDFPDYRGVDFSRYLCLADQENPMHRLWSDGHWLKAYLAWGCYWGRCAFCDTTLDYIRGYRPVDVEALFRRLCRQAEATGVRGVHLVDEAAPPEALLRLSCLNREAGFPLLFWGNIRFDAKAFTPDRAALLAAGGLLGVSGGIEIATEAGLRRLDKGISLPDLASCLAAFKEAGILTHGYLIYGYWDEDEQELIDSAETVRQFFQAGLLDSAFWHQFILTCHSRLYDEWRRGLHPGLRVRDAPSSFARNDLSFDGEARWRRYTACLDRLLARWMAGDFFEPARFPFKTPPATVAPDFTAGLLDAYARRRNFIYGRFPGAGTEKSRGRVWFLGSRPLSGKGGGLFWRWRLADVRLPGSEALASLLTDAACSEGMDRNVFCRRLTELCGAEKAAALWARLRQSGLVEA